MAPTGNVTQARLIAAPPALVRAVNATAGAFLAGLPAPDFRSVADAKALWAAPAVDHGSGGTCYVISAEAYKRVKARRYT